MRETEVCENGLCVSQREYQSLLVCGHKADKNGNYCFLTDDQNLSHPLQQAHRAVRTAKHGGTSTRFIRASGDTAKPAHPSCSDSSDSGGFENSAVLCLVSWLLFQNPSVSVYLQESNKNNDFNIKLRPCHSSPRLA